MSLRDRRDGSSVGIILRDGVGDLARRAYRGAALPLDTSKRYLTAFLGHFGCPWSSAGRLESQVVGVQRGTSDQAPTYGYQLSNWLVGDGGWQWRLEQSYRFFSDVLPARGSGRYVNRPIDIPRRRCWTHLGWLQGPKQQQPNGLDIVQKNWFPNDAKKHQATAHLLDHPTPTPTDSSLRELHHHVAPFPFVPQSLLLHALEN